MYIIHLDQQNHVLVFVKYRLVKGKYLSKYWEQSFETLEFMLIVLVTTSGLALNLCSLQFRRQMVLGSGSVCEWWCGGGGEGGGGADAILASQQLQHHNVSSISEDVRV